MNYDYITWTLVFNAFHTKLLSYSGIIGKAMNGLEGLSHPKFKKSWNPLIFNVIYYMYTYL